MANEIQFVKGIEDNAFLTRYEQLKNAGIRVYFVTTESHNIIRLY